ncbi:MAG: hypothetical protein AAB289_07775 [Chloroflexota bacterium]
MTTSDASASGREQAIKAMVQRVVQQELAHTEAEAVAALAPLIEQSILEAIAIGAELGGGLPLASMATPAEAPPGEPQPKPATPPQAAPTAPAGTGTAVLDGSMTLVVSPFQGYVDVQRFIRDLERTGLVQGVRPKRFANGRLFVLLQADSGDTRSLAQSLIEAVPQYRLSLRSLQQDLVEMVLEPPPEEPV